MAADQRPHCIARHVRQLIFGYGDNANFLNEKGLLALLHCQAYYVNCDTWLLIFSVYSPPFPMKPFISDG
jgi:hypothetical protein